MLEILQFYVSSFWTWVGITVGLWIIFNGVILTVMAMLTGKNK